MLKTITDWLERALPLIEGLAEATWWTDADDKFLVWAKQFVANPEAAVKGTLDAAGEWIRFGLLKLLGWLEDFGMPQDVGDFFRKLIVNPVEAAAMVGVV